MTDADDRFLETLARELDPLLGPRLHLSGLDLERLDDGTVRIVALVDASSGRQRLVEEGETLTTVAASLLERAPVHRLADGFRELVDPSTVRSPA